MTICKGESKELYASMNSTGTKYYSWTSGSNSKNNRITIAPTITTNYKITANDINSGCTASAQIIVTVKGSKPIAEAGPSRTICQETGVSATLNGSGGSIYSWSTNEKTQRITVTPTTNRIYYLTVTDNDGCTASDFTSVTVITNGSCPQITNDLVKIDAKVKFPDNSSGLYGKCESYEYYCSPKSGYTQRKFIKPIIVCYGFDLWYV